MKLTKESLKKVIKEELEALLNEQERTGTLEVGYDNNQGPVLVFSFNQDRGEGKVIEVFLSQLKGMTNDHIEHIASNKGKQLKDVHPTLPGYFAKKFEAPYNNAELLAGLQIAHQWSWSSRP